MPEPSNDSELPNWHRRFASEANNEAWRRSEAASRSPDEDQAMVDAAHAAAYHWRAVGTDVQIARAVLLLAHVHALLGHGSVAMRHARTAFESITSRRSPEWEVALAHAVLANAASAVGDHALHAQHHALAKSMGRALASAEEREIFDTTFVRIPVPDADAALAR